MKAALLLVVASLLAAAEAHAAEPVSPPFRLAEAPSLPSLKEGGFAETPAFEDDFGPDWEERQKAWRVATWKQNNTQMSPERCRTDAEGRMVQTVLAGEPARGGSMQTAREFGYGRWIARVKPSAVPGLLNSIFTKDWDNLETPENQHDGDKAEVDIEFLSHSYGKDTGQVHLAIHLKDKANFWHSNFPLDFNPSDAFREWGFDILPDKVVWHVDGKIIHTWPNTTENHVGPGYEFFFNSWTQQRWIKGPPMEDGKYLIDWVRFYPVK